MQSDTIDEQHLHALTGHTQLLQLHCYGVRVTHCDTLCHIVLQSVRVIICTLLISVKL